MLWTVKLVSLINLLLLLSFYANAVEKRLGLPKIINYNKDDYKAATMNWDILKGSGGKMYFANNYGLISYDGISWDLVLEPTNRTNIASLGVNSRDEMFIGAHNEFGYVVRNGIGQVNYKSLNHLIDTKDESYGLVTSIISHENKVYFFTKNRIFVYYENKIDVIRSTTDIIFAQKVNGVIYLQEKGKPLSILKEEGIVPVKGGQKTVDIDIQNLFFIENKLVLLTATKGFFEIENGVLSKWNTKAGNTLENCFVNSGIQLSNGNLAIGTLKDGLFVFSNKGEQLLSISKKDGLQNNTIHAIYEDETQNIWLALSNGISYIELGSDFYYVDTRNGIDGSVYSTSVFDDRLYIATNQGVFSTNLQSSNLSHFNFIEGTDAHSWNMSIINDKLFLGNHNGSFEIRNDQAIPINKNEMGCWQFVQHPQKTNYLFQGSYHGVFIYQLENDTWKVTGKLKGFDETTREMTFDENGNLWIGHGYQGIYKLQLNDKLDSIVSITLYNKDKGLPDNYWNSLFTVRGEILIGSQEGVYEYNEEKDVMQPNEHYQRILGKTLIRRLVEMPNGGIFFVSGLDNEDVIGIIKEDNNFEIQTVPFQKLRGELIPAFESIVFYDNQILIGSKDGLIIYNQEVTRSSTPFQTSISRVFCTNANDSIIYGHPGDFMPNFFPVGFKPRLPYRYNAIRINYSASYFEASENILFRTYLEGFDNDWTNWTEASGREFTNLLEGDYVFHVESKNIYDIVGNEAIYEFSIAPPWYRTVFMYTVYVILIAMGVAFFLNLRRRQILALENKRRDELYKKEQEHQRKNLESERKLTQLQMEKLRAEVDYKSRELASSTLHLAQQNDTVLKAIDRIEAIDTIKNQEAIRGLRSVVKSLKEMISDDSNWEQFELHFNEIHDDFIKRIKSVYPALTARDVRLCAYLRMNLTSKEMAPLLGISYRGVEALRYRIRKKLELASNENLTDFILEF